MQAESRAPEPVPAEAKEDAVSDLSVTYGASFHCIGPACEDLCCRQWEIPVDAGTYDRWMQAAARPLREQIVRLVTIAPQPSSPATFASVARRDSGDCAFLEEDRLCSIQKQMGAELLPAACSIYPRSLARVGERLEVSLSLSCPEAARRVLLDERFQFAAEVAAWESFRTDNVFRLRRRVGLLDAASSFDGVRRAVIACVRDRSEPLETRLLRLGAFCIELDAASTEAGAVAACSKLAAKTATVPVAAAADARAKIQMAFDLSAMQIDDPSAARFAEVFLWFAQGLSAQGGELESFMLAEREYARPFFAARPHLLENLLLNHILQTLFPFGREGSGDFFTRTAWEEYVQMAMRFAWAKTLLTGVAGCLRAELSEAHAVQVAQSLARATEHYPQVLASLHDYLRARRLDHLQGIAVLVAD